MLPLTEMKKLWYFHDDFIKSVFPDIYHHDHTLFVKKLKNYYISRELDSEEVIRVLTTKVYHGMIQESIMMYLDVIIRELGYEYERFGSSEILTQAYRWTKIRDALRLYIDKNS